MITSGPFDQLVATYEASRQICLFTGAGASWTQDKDYRAPSWRELLCELLIALLRKQKQKKADALLKFQSLSNKYPDPWDLASAILELAEGEDQFIRMLRKAIIRKNETRDQYGRLKTRNLKGATTLNALISFCSKVEEINVHPCFAINPKIRAILTANYDWTLEAGGTTKHQAGRFKPMSRPTSTVEPGDLPVYHIHGYLPQSEKIIPAVPLILDRRSYEEAYRENSWTRKVIEDFLGNYPTLFIGFSFEDEFLLRALHDISRRPGTPRHYALLRGGDQRPPRLLARIEDSGVSVILYEEHFEIPDLLYRVYFGNPLVRQDIAIRCRNMPRKSYSTMAVWEMLTKDKKWIPG